MPAAMAAAQAHVCCSWLPRKGDAPKWCLPKKVFEGALPMLERQSRAPASKQAALSDRIVSRLARRVSMRAAGFAAPLRVKRLRHLLLAGAIHTCGTCETDGRCAILTRPDVDFAGGARDNVV